MTKKKDFKGLTQDIMKNQIKSIDDFLSYEKDESADSAIISQNKTLETSELFETQNNSDEMPLTLEIEVAKAQVQDPVAPEPESLEIAASTNQEVRKTRMSLFVAVSTVYILDQLKANMRRMAPISDLSKISKSAIIETAVAFISSDFEKYGTDSLLFKKIVKK